RACLRDLGLVTGRGLVLLVVDVKDGLAVDDLVVKRVRRLVGDGDLDGLVAGAARNETDLGAARIALAGSGGGHGGACGLGGVRSGGGGGLGFLLRVDRLEARDVLAEE